MLQSITTVMEHMENAVGQESLPWNKLEKGQKLQKLNKYADQYALEHALSEEQHAKLKDMMKERLSRKQLQKSKDVAYDKMKGVVTHIDCLVFNPDGTFSFRNTDSVSPLVSLAPKTRKLRLDVGANLSNHAS